MLLSLPTLCCPARPIPLRGRFLNPLPLPPLDLHRKGNCVGGSDHKAGRLGCRAELAQDAPFAAAIGVSILNSLVFPAYDEVEEEDGGGPLDSTDTRLGVMGIISLIPYFNWMSWVFAWLDTGKQRYLVYSLVYLAPYFRTNLSLSTEESWLPIASILLCIIHVQLEISIKNGDLGEIKFLNAVQNLFKKGSLKERPKRDHKRGQSKSKEKQNLKLPSVQEPKNKLRDWEVPDRQSDRHQWLDADKNAEEKGKSD